MADSENKKESVPALLPRKSSSQEAARSSRLAVMPLAVLLPCLGDVSELHLVSEKLERRLANVHSQAANFAAEESEEKSARSIEELMLNQVLQWLAVGESED